MRKTTLFILTTALVNVAGYTPQAIAASTTKKLRIEMQNTAFKTCKIKAEELSEMPFAAHPDGDQTPLLPKNIIVVLDDPNAIPNNNRSNNNDQPNDPVLTTTLDELLKKENLLGHVGEVNTARTHITLIDIDANGHCDLFVSSPYENASLYLANSSGSLINMPIDSKIPLGELSLTPIYIKGSDIPSILYRSSNHWGSKAGVITWQKSSKKIFKETLNTAKKANSLAAFKYFYNLHIAEAVKHLRAAELDKANVSLAEARYFDNGSDYQRNYYTGIINHLNKKYRNAEKYFIAASKLPVTEKKERASIFYNLGLTQEAMGNKQEAKKSFEEYLSILPNGKYSQEIKNHRLK